MNVRDRIKKLTSLMNDPAATANEKNICARLIESYKHSPEVEREESATGEEYDWRADLYKHLHEYWTTADGRRIHYTKMESGHLINTILYIRRTLCDDDLLQEIPIYANMIKEAEKRGIVGAIYAYQKKGATYV